MGFNVKDDASFEAWGKDVDEKLSKVQGLDEIKTTVDAMNTKMETMAADFGRRVLPIEGEQKRLPVSKDDFAKVGVKAVMSTPVQAKAGQGAEDVRHEDDRIAELHSANDLLLLLKTALDANRVDYGGSVKNLKFYRTHFRPALEKALAGLDTAAAGALLEFDPTEYSSTLIEKVRLARVVPSLFKRLAVPRFPIVLPTFLNDVVASKFAENTADPVSGTLIADGAVANISGSVTMSGVSLAMQISWSWELDEDSIIPMLGFLEMAVVHGIGNAIEKAIINGDLTATHLDTDTAAAASTTAAKAFSGLRFNAGMGTGTGTAKQAATGKINTDAQWRDYGPGYIRGLMGKYGVNSADLALIVSPIGVNQLRSCEAFRTIYAFGAGATNTTGGVPNPNGNFRPDGMNLAVSEFMRDDLAATGVNTAPSDNYTSMLLVNTNAYLLGELRSLRTQVLNEVYAPGGQRGIIASWRGDFKSVFAASGNHTGIAYAISTV